MSTADIALSTLEHRTKVRTLAAGIARAGVEAMRRNLHVIRAAQTFNKFYRMDFFTPYEYQRRWFSSGSQCLLRYLSAANRIGKTYGAAHEFAYHATGLYPEWWNGFRCDAGTLWANDRSRRCTTRGQNQNARNPAGAD